MNLIDKYINGEFNSYEDLKNNLKINIPDNFNFGFDVVDELARISPDKRALVWCDDYGNERTFTFKEISEYSNKTANFLVSLGIKKGDRVMLILKETTNSGLQS